MYLYLSKCLCIVFRLFLHLMHWQIYALVSICARKNAQKPKPDQLLTSLSFFFPLQLTKGSPLFSAEQFHVSLINSWILAGLFHHFFWWLAAAESAHHPCSWWGIGNDVKQHLSWLSLSRSGSQKESGVWWWQGGHYAGGRGPRLLARLVPWRGLLGACIMTSLRGDQCLSQLNASAVIPHRHQ